MENGESTDAKVVIGESWREVKREPDDHSKQKRSIDVTKSDKNAPSDDEPLTKKRASEFDKLWGIVNENPTDFQAWTHLLQHVDQVSALQSGRMAYNAFFSRYPYCYGYWKKFADLEKRKGTEESVIQVFKQGVAAIGLSVDLWVHYVDYVVSNFGDDEDYVRSVFKEAVDMCGMEFKSDKLWDLYINWEAGGKRWSKVFEVYERLLAVPVAKYAQHWLKFQEFLKQHPPEEVLNPEAYVAMRLSLVKELHQGKEESIKDELPPGDEHNDEKKLPVVPSEEEIRLLRRDIIASKQKVYELTMALAKARFPYEDAIKRPYFHVKPLEKSQLSAWRNYLEFEIKEAPNFGNLNRITILFERCLIACALYEEFWMRYIMFMETQCTPPLVIRTVFERACSVHLRDKIRPHLAWAAFEEACGQPAKAVSILQEVIQRNDAELEAYMMLTGIHRRQNKLEEAENVYKNCLAKFREKDALLSCQIVVKYARFVALFRGDGQRALSLLNEALENGQQNNPSLLLAIADIAMHCSPPNVRAAADAFAKGTQAAVSSQIRIMFAHRHLQFLIECSSDPQSITESLHQLRELQILIRKQGQPEEEKPHKEPQQEEKKPETVVPSRPKSYGEKHSTHSHNYNSHPSHNPSPSNSNFGGPPPANNHAYQNYTGQQQPAGNFGYNNQSNHQYPPPHHGYNMPPPPVQYPQQNWGYSGSSGQGGYNYNHNQGWGGYQNYYGQR